MPIPAEITTLVFDWGDTLMALDTRFDGVMAGWPEVRAVPGVAQSLAVLQERFRLVVATNAADSNAAQVRAALARVGLDGYFETILTFHELGARKPSPQFFQRAAHILGAAPCNLVMIGDDYDNDIPGARRAGWRAVWYNPALKPAPGPGPLHDAELSQMDTLPAALSQLDLPDPLTCQTWYLEQSGVATLWQHVEAVSLAAYHLAVLLRAAGHPVNPLLAHRGGLVHDIAKISAKRLPDGNHGELGAEVLLAKDQPLLAEISRRHLLFYLLDPLNAPRTWEEKIVHYTDKICEGPRFVSWSERLEGLASRYPAAIEKMRACTPAVLALQAELAQAAGIRPDDLVATLRQAANH